jgi:hypothetical protein
MLVKIRMATIFCNLSGVGNAVPNQNVDKDQFLNPIGRYRGEFSPERLAFNANLQEFASRVSLLCGLETGGKIPPDQAYKEIKQLWKDLKESKKALLDQAEQPRPELPDE